ncbi:MAG: hypothetical protein AB8G86_13810 [Saprospiraceae bacterium]
MIKINFKPLLALAFFSLVFFMVSCEKESLNAEVTEITENYVNQSVFEMQKRGNAGKFGCYEFVFPISINLPDGSVVSVESFEDLRAGIADWKGNNSAAKERPHLAFPIEVVSEEGAVISVEDFVALGALRRACAKKFFENTKWEDIKGCFVGGFRGGRPDGVGGGRPDGVGGGRPDGVGGGRPDGVGGGRPDCMNGDRCFRLAFPVTVNYPDGSSENFDTHVALKKAARTWRMANQASTTTPQLAFPLTIEMEDGTTQSVESKDELKAIKDNCSSGS